MNKTNRVVVAIDDDESVLSALGVVLSEYGLDVELVSDSRKALGVIESSKPAMIFLDLVMPYMDGEEVLKILSESSGDVKKIPVILLSASGGIEVIAAKYNTAGYIKKPFDLDHLYSIISNYIPPIA